MGALITHVWRDPGGHLLRVDPHARVSKEQWPTATTRDLDDDLQDAVQTYAAAVSDEPEDDNTWEIAGGVLLAALLLVLSRAIARGGQRAVRDEGFSADNRYSQAWLSLHGQDLAAYLESTARGAVKQAKLSGLDAGSTAAEIKQRIAAGDYAGLLEKQVAGVEKDRAEWIAGGMTMEKADARAAKEALSLVEERAERIAETEVMRGINQGGQHAQIGSGGDMVRIWDNDMGPCPFCRPFVGTTADAHGLFHSSEGDVSGGPPLHVGCRCSSTRLVLRLVPEPAQKSATVHAGAITVRLLWDGWTQREGVWRRGQG